MMKLSKNKKNKIVILSKIKFKDWYILVQQKIALDAIERRYPEKKEREREGKKNKRKPYFRRAYRAVDDFFSISSTLTLLHL